MASTDTAAGSAAVTIPAGTIAVRPARGMAVRLPERAMRLLRDDGELVPERDFWLRRVAVGDVVQLSEEQWAATVAEREAKWAEEKAAAEKAAADKAAEEKAAADKVASGKLAAEASPKS